MKRIFKVVALSLFGIVLFGACGNTDEKQITQAANNYLNAFIKDLDPVKAKEFATPESAAFLDMIHQVQGMSGNMDESRKENQSMIFELGKIEINGETATVPFTSVLNKERNEEVLQLRKVDRKWLVHQAKESPESAAGQEKEEDVSEIVK